MEPDNYNSEKSENFPGDVTYNRKKNLIGSYAIIALTFLVLSLIFLTFNLRLLAGILVIAGASFVVLLTRKTGSLSESPKEPLAETPSPVGEKEKVISEFSHRIREPLNNLVLLADLLMDSGPQKRQKDLLETFVASTNNMVTIVNELTMQSAVNLPHAPGKNIRYNILSTIQNTIDLYSLKADSSLDIVFTKRDYNEYECNGDPIILKQIFLDIFSTIEEQGTEMPTRVNISARKEKEIEGGRIIGFRIQTDRNNILIDQATGAGKLASKLIMMSRGNFSQEAGENCSVLNINIPFAYFNAGIKSSPSAASAGVQRPALDLSECSILLVEDNLINQKITLLTLKPLVKNIDTASNGSEAIEKMMRSKYDIILLDIRMPVMDGLATAEKIREMEQGKEAHVPIIAITADAMIGDRERCLSAGIDEYISKAYQPAQLIATIKELLS
jgi:CheY-like chemotaxis protein